MQTKIDQRLLDEVEQFSLRFTCDDCEHFEAASEGCSLGFPNQEHRLGLFQELGPRVTRVKSEVAIRASLLALGKPGRAAAPQLLEEEAPMALRLGDSFAFCKGFELG